MLLHFTLSVKLQYYPSNSWKDFCIGYGPFNCESFYVKRFDWSNYKNLTALVGEPYGNVISESLTSRAGARSYPLILSLVFQMTLA